MATARGTRNNQAGQHGEPQTQIFNAIRPRENSTVTYRHPQSAPSAPGPAPPSPDTEVTKQHVKPRNSLWKRTGKGPHALGTDTGERPQGNRDREAGYGASEGKNSPRSRPRSTGRLCSSPLINRTCLAEITSSGQANWGQRRFYWHRSHKPPSEGMAMLVLPAGPSSPGVEQTSLHMSYLQYADSTHSCCCGPRNSGMGKSCPHPAPGSHPSPVTSATFCLTGLLETPTEAGFVSQKTPQRKLRLKRAVHGCGCAPLEKNQIFPCSVYTQYLICTRTKNRLEPILEMRSS